MIARLHRLWQAPPRLSLGQAKLFGGLAVAILVLAATGLVLYGGWPRVVHVSALALVGLANLAWVLGSILPEGPRARAARLAMVPLTLLMLVALAVSVILHIQTDGGDGGIILAGLIGGLASVVAVRLLNRP